ncbi:hypothetical protein FACS189420_5810 [Bacteroidia bacterium]|nr:hypothetical protein FACS18947_2950 [Bacteroidia bacterium]GHV71282.1 hypothetical protein FACS189420_5810 [Bacteroidia bacterium]
MKNLKLLIGILAIIGMTACNGKKTAEETKYPLFWTWFDYRANMNFDSICAVMSETGIDGVMLNAPTPDDYRTAIPIAHKYGIEVYAWLWTMNLEHDRDSIVKAHPEWFSVNRKGESLADHVAYVNYYKFMCPALPEVREHIRKKIVAYCEVEGLNGIAIDYHRLVDVILPTTLWPKYGIVQDREYPEWDYGYHPAMIEKFVAKYGYDPRELADPSTDEQWLQFRCDQVTEVANEIAEVVHSYGKVMAASPFPTPKMAKSMVRQDWGKWNLDIVFPMVYANFYTGDVSFISDCTIENVRDKNPMTTLYCGMSGVNGPEMFESMDAALNNGAEGIAIFTVRSLRSPEIRARFKAYTDSVRALRATTKINPKATGRTAVNINPFENEGIMQAAQKRMQGFIAEDGAATLALGEYKLVDEYGTTKCYQVTDEQSKIVFDVKFYLYGGIIAGWSVEPEAASYEQFKKGNKS